MIDDLLHLARLDQRRPLDLAPTDIGCLVDDAVADAHVIQPNRPIAVQIDATHCRAGMLVIDADEDLLRQAIANVIGNALVHTDPDVEVVVSARADVDGDGVIIDVTDRGHGMDPQTVERVTERFYRADPARSRHRGGSGLGLSIVDAAVLAHHGSLSVLSAAGAGTTVSMALPRHAGDTGREDE